MHSITRYKKIGMIVPLVCLLGTGITFVNQPIHAAAATTSNVSAGLKKVDVDTLRKDISERFLRLQLNRPELLGLKSNALFEKDGDLIHDSMIDTTIKMSINNTINNWNPLYGNTTPNYEVTAKPGNVEHESLDVFRYSNTTLDPQELITDAKNVEKTDTLTLTHSAGGSLGYSYSASVKVGIPLIGDGTASHTFKVDANYNYTNTHTTTEKESRTFPSQKVICRPGYTTVLTIDRSKAHFSGEMEYEIGTNVQELINDINKGINKVKETQTTKIYNIDPNPEEFLYNLYKNSGMEIPSYVTLDDKHKTVSFGKVTSNYEGVIGNISDITATVIPINSPEKEITMPFKEYQQKVKNNESF